VTVRVVKIGGAALSDGGWLDELAAAVAQADSPLVVVHGGGPEISALCERLSVPVSWHEGRRVTTAEALDAASMVLTGRINKRIVGALVRAGIDGLGLSGEDAGLLRAELAEGGALGRVGVISAVRTALLHDLLARGLVPMLSPISIGPDDAPVNVNADEAAAAIAVALGADDLVFLTDVAGVHDGARVRGELRAADAAAFVASGIAHGGMAVKLRAALHALERGVRSVRIGPPALLHQSDLGTRIHALEVAA
jgi:acetylglutamate kinase